MIGQDTFSALAPVQGKKMAMSPSSAVHGDQYDTKYVTFELLLHAAFVADEIWGFMLEPAREKNNLRPVTMETRCFHKKFELQRYLSLIHI